MAKRPPPGPKPQLTRERVLAALAEIGGLGGKNDLARKLQLSPDERRDLRAMLKEMEAEGVIGRSGRRNIASAAALPEKGVFEIVDRDTEGELLAQMRGREGLFGPLLRLGPSAQRIVPALGVGDRILATTARDEDGTAIAHVVKRLGQSAHRLLGVFHAVEDPRGRGGAGGRIELADRKARHDLIVLPEHVFGAKQGDLVVAELAEGARPTGPKRAVVREILGHVNDPRAASILAIHAHGVPMGFAPDEEAEAMAAPAPTLKGRTDLRHLPLITIDPEDARDHDDAVFALPDEDEKNPGGWRVYVAIADVAAYVRPGSALDRGAYKRGNSTYFPDRVAAMLPEHLSAGLCSLKEGEERACFAVEITFDKDGKKRRHRFVRGLMKSAARLTYAEAQAAFDDKPSAKTAPLMDQVLKPLYAAYLCVKQARDVRSPLGLETAEHRIVFGPSGEVAGVKKRETLEANKLIEEFMIQANVAAAEELEKRQQPLVYRVHDRPSKEKIAALTDFLPTVGMNWAKGQTVTPARFNRLLQMSQASEHRDLINEVILRTQAQAIYSPENIGHFGLNLASYAHFTSPIRRYADVIVHRALIKALKLGEDGIREGEEARLEETAEHISMCERRSMAAEREATERYIAAYLAEKVGAEFTGKVSGVTRFGLFVKLDETQADGLVPISSLGPERWAHEETQHALVGQSSGRRFHLGQRVEVRLSEAAPVSGGLVFEMLTEPLEPAAGWKRSAQPAMRFRPAPPRGGARPPKTKGRKRK